MKRKLKNPKTRWQRFRTWFGCKIAGIDYRSHIIGQHLLVQKRGRIVWEQLNEQSNYFAAMPKRPFPRDAELKTCTTDPVAFEKLFNPNYKEE